MWLPRLRFTLVPRSSRSPFRRVVFFFFVVCLGVFCKFFSTKVQLHLCFSQAQRVKGRSEGYCPFLSKYLIRTRYPRSDQKRERFPSSCAKWAPKAPPQRGQRRRQVHPLPGAPGTAPTVPRDGLYPKHEGRFERSCSKPQELGCPPPFKIKKSFVIGLIKMKPDLSFFFSFVCFLYFINVHFKLNL